jgi:CelD/BcsL family acetyltransferase involved in cellulose biosynthesis
MDVAAAPPTEPLLVTSEDFEALAPEWEALFARVPGAPPFLHPAWQRTWLRHFGAETSPVFLALRRGNELAGVAALDVGSGGTRQLGDHNVTDYAGPLVLPGFEEAACGAAIEWLMEELASSMLFWGVAADSPLRPAIAAGAARFGWTCEEEHEAVCPRAELPGDFETFLAGLSKHDRHELRRKLRNLGAAGDVQFHVFRSPEEIGGRMDRFLELMRISRDDKDEFLTPAMEQYFRDVARTFADLGMMRLAVLSLDGRDAAMILYFESETTVFLYNSGYDPEFSKLAVGLLSKALALQDAIGRGMKTFDFLRGEEEYKRHLGGAPVEVLRLRLAAP